MLIGATLSVLLATAPVPTSQAPLEIVVDASQRHQVIDGFGVNLNVNSWNGGELAPALDRLIDVLGASLFRVYLDNADWEAENDNADAGVFEEAAYQRIYTSARLEDLWGTLGHLRDRGVLDRTVLNFMGPVPAWMGGDHVDVAMEDEWVEMLVSLLHHARTVRGLPVTRLSPFNEPDWNCKEGACVDEAQMLRLLRKLAARLAAMDMRDIRLTAPETANIQDGARRYTAALLAAPDVMATLDRVAVHSYIEHTGGIGEMLRGSRYPDTRFWVSEQSFGNDRGLTFVASLMAALRQGASATLIFKAYDGQDRHHPAGEDYDLGLLEYDRASRRYTPRPAFHVHAQFARFIRPGARRVEARAPSADLPVIAAVDGDRATVVGLNRSEAAQAVTVVFAGATEVRGVSFHRTTPAAGERVREVPIGTLEGGRVTVSVPAQSVFTLTGVLSPVR